MKRTVEIDRGQCGMFSWRQTVKSTDLVRLSQCRSSNRPRLA